MDRSLEASASDDRVLAMRVFDAGPFHAGFGIIVPADDDTIQFCLDAKARGAPPPFRHSLAATLYGDAIRAETPMSPEEAEFLWDLLTKPPTTAATSKGRATPKTSRRARSTRKR